METRTYTHQELTRIMRDFVNIVAKHTRKEPLKELTFSREQLTTALKGYLSTYEGECFQRGIAWEIERRNELLNNKPKQQQEFAHINETRRTQIAHMYAFGACDCGGKRRINAYDERGKFKRLVYTCEKCGKITEKAAKSKGDK